MDADDFVVDCGATDSSDEGSEDEAFEMIESPQQPSTTMKTPIDDNNNDGNKIAADVDEEDHAVIISPVSSATAIPAMLENTKTHPLLFAEPQSKTSDNNNNTESTKKTEQEQDVAAAPVGVIAAPPPPTRDEAAAAVATVATVVVEKTSILPTPPSVSTERVEKQATCKCQAQEGVIGSFFPRFRCVVCFKDMCETCGTSHPASHLLILIKTPLADLHATPSVKTVLAASLPSRGCNPFGHSNEGRAPRNNSNSNNSSSTGTTPASVAAAPSASSSAASSAPAASSNNANSSTTTATTSSTSSSSSSSSSRRSRKVHLPSPHQTPVEISLEKEALSGAIQEAADDIAAVIRAINPFSKNGEKKHPSSNNSSLNINANTHNTNNNSIQININSNAHRSTATTTAPPAAASTPTYASVVGVMNTPPQRRAAAAPKTNINNSNNNNNNNSVENAPVGRRLTSV